MGQPSHIVVLVYCAVCLHDSRRSIQGLQRFWLTAPSGKAPICCYLDAGQMGITMEAVTVVHLKHNSTAHKLNTVKDASWNYTCAAAWKCSSRWAPWQCSTALLMYTHSHPDLSNEDIKSHNCSCNHEQVTDLAGTCWASSESPPA